MSEFAGDWEACTVADLVTHETAGVDPSEVDGVPYVGLEHLDSGEMSLSRWGDPSTVRSRKTCFHPGDILYGKLRPYLDKAALADRSGVGSTDILVLRPKSAVDPYFATALLHTKPFVAHAIATTTGVNHPRTSWRAISSYKVRLPPFVEQRAIAHVLRTIQRAKEATEQVIAAARELKKSLMRQLFTYGPIVIGEAASSELSDSPAGRISQHWHVARLGDIARIERGRFAHRPRNDPAYYGGSVPFIQTGDVTEAGGRITKHSQTLNEKGLGVSKMFPARTIAITIAANIGYCGILTFDSAFPDSLIGITPKYVVLNEFLNYYLMTQQPEMDRLAPRGTQKNINIRFLEPWPVPLPPFEEQATIAEILRVADGKMAAEEALRDALTTLFDSLLHDLMTARLRVHELESRRIADHGYPIS